MIKSLALGAKGVLLGRPYCFGLAFGGEQGVVEVLADLIADIDLTLGLVGCSGFSELGQEAVVEETLALARIIQTESDKEASDCV